MKEKSFDLGRNRTNDLRIRSTVTLPTELRGRTFDILTGRDDMFYFIFYFFIFLFFLTASRRNRSPNNKKIH